MYSRAQTPGRPNNSWLPICDRAIASSFASLPAKRQATSTNRPRRSSSLMGPIRPSSTTA
eukprot:6576425-Alexandrium_andersonii.AAC.1